MNSKASSCSRAGLLAAFASTIILMPAGGLNLDFSTKPETSPDSPITVMFPFYREMWVTTPAGAGGGDRDGYLSLTDAANGQWGAVVFKELDPGQAVKAFTFRCKLRVGGGTEVPADGMSINFVDVENEPEDGLIFNLENGTKFGPFAGTKWEPNLPEEGSTNGLAIGFDAYPSGLITDTVQDEVGVSVRVNGELKHQAALPTRHKDCTDPTSLQTGPAGDVVGLKWCDLLIQIDLVETMGTLRLRIAWKHSIPLIDPPMVEVDTGLRPYRGRFVLAARTGGFNQAHHIDEIAIDTTAYNTQVGKPSSVALPSGTVTFSEVTEAGTTTAVGMIVDEIPAVPGVFRFGDPPTCWKIATTAKHTGDIQVCIGYDATSFKDGSALQLLHYEGGDWVDVTSSLDPVNHQICGRVTSLSPFAVVEPAPLPELRIIPTATGFSCSWPASFAGFGLEAADTLVETAEWSPVTTPPVLEGDQKVVTLQFEGRTKFLRLKQP